MSWAQGESVRNCWSWVSDHSDGGDVSQNGAERNSRMARCFIQVALGRAGGPKNGDRPLCPRMNRFGRLGFFAFWIEWSAAIYLAQQTVRSVQERGQTALSTADRFRCLWLDRLGTEKSVPFLGRC